MKVYLLTEADFERLHLALHEDPRNGNVPLTPAKQEAHDEAYRRFNLVVRTWEASVKEAK